MKGLLETIKKELSTDPEFLRLTKKNGVVGDKLEPFFSSCVVAYCEVLSVSQYKEPPVSATRREYLELFNLLKKLELKFDQLDIFHSGVSDIFDKLSQSAPGNVRYAAQQIKNPIWRLDEKFHTFIFHAKTVSEWLSENYERQDGRGDRSQPNAKDTDISAFYRKLSALVQADFNKPFDGLVATATNVLLQPINPITTNRVARARISKKK